jgi:hypothetical protein
MPVNRKMMKAMKEQYGPEKGERIYYAKEQEMKKKSGYMGGGTAMKKDSMGGGMAKPMMKKMGYAPGGVVKANCGASMKPNRKAKK